MILLSAKLEAANTYTGDAEKPDPEDVPAAAPKGAKPSANLIQNGLNIPHVSTTFVGLAPKLPAPALVTPLAPTLAPAPISAAKAKKQRRKARKASATPTIEVALPTEGVQEDAGVPDSATRYLPVPSYAFDNSHTLHPAPATLGSCHSPSPFFD